MSDKAFEQQVENRSEVLRVRAERACKNSIGLPYRIRVSKNEVYSGVIVEARVKEVEVAPRWRGAVLYAWMEVVMECGQNKTRKSFTVNTLPQC